MTQKAAIEAAVKALEEALKCQTKKNDYPTVIWIQEALTLLRAIPEQAGDLEALKRENMELLTRIYPDKEYYEFAHIVSNLVIDKLAASGATGAGVEGYIDGTD